MKKNVKRINESQLRAIVSESIKKVLKESTSNWRGCPNVHMIWHGTNSDPELEADGCIANYWGIEDAFWYEFLEDSGWNDCDSDNPQCEDEFNRWLQDHESDVIMAICDASRDYNEEDSINESALNEYQLGDLTKRVGAGLSTITGNKGNISQRLQNAKANFKTQGEINDMNELLMKLQKYVDMKVFNPNATIAELIGNKWMKKGDKQGIKQRAGGLRGNIKQRGGQWH